jgi:hypothetical protein
MRNLKNEVCLTSETKKIVIALRDFVWKLRLRLILQNHIHDLHNLDQFLIHHGLPHDLHVRGHTFTYLWFIYTIISLASLFVQKFTQDLHFGSYTTSPFKNAASSSFFARPATSIPAGQFNRFANTVYIGTPYVSCFGAVP